ncbi:WD40-repeat-containing domain protein [Mycena polygramma]|nr:WD40-repeat-containing domain protein [Mycena polygramma]
MRLWEVNGGALKERKFKHEVPQGYIATFSPDGERIAYARSNEEDVGADILGVWNVHTGVHVESELQQYSIKSLSFSPNGTRIVSGDFHRGPMLWDAATGTEIVGFFKVDVAHVGCVAFSPDGKHIVSGGSDETVHVWDSQTGALVGRLRGHTEVIISVAFTPDGRRIASGAGDASIRVWDAETALGSAAYPRSMGHTQGVTWVQFSSDGNRITSGSKDSTVKVWDSSTGALLTTSKPGAPSIWTLVFSPDGRRIASGYVDGIVHVWNSETCTVVGGPFEGHPDTVTSVHFSPDCRRIVSGSSDGTIRVWEDAAFRDDSKRDTAGYEDGWIRDPLSAGLLWVPPWLRCGLYSPRNSLVICAEGTTELDLTRFVHGRNWDKCVESE